MNENKFTAARLVVLILTAGLVAVVVLVVKFFIGIAFMRMDMSVYTKMKGAMTYYITANTQTQLPGGIRMEEDPAPLTGKAVNALTNMELLSYTDTYARSIKRSIVFRNCGDHIAEPILPLCVGFAQEPGKITPLNADTWPPPGSTISSVPLRFACYAEMILDDRNYNSGNGFANGPSAFTYPDSCLSEPMDYDTSGYFDYLFSVSGY